MDSRRPRQSNSERYLAAFNAIEGTLRRRLGGDPSLTFHQLLRQLAPSDRAVRSAQLDLQEFAELRNAIVHARSGQVLAEPNDEAVGELERIRSVIEAPPRVDAVIGRREVVTTDPEAPIRAAAEVMRRGNFSQLPVFRAGAFHALLTTSGVSRWVAEMLTSNDGILEDAPVQTVLAFEEDTEVCTFLPPTATVHQALEQFEKFAARGHQLQAILISEGGRANASPLNIVTVYDVPKLAQSVSSAA